MMKMTKNVLILSIVGFCMIACSSNETEIELSKSKIAAPTVNGKRLVKIKHGETYTSIEYNSQGQVSKVKHHSKDGTTREDTYWYEDRRVIWSPLECIYNLGNGLAVECNYTALILGENAMTVECRNTYAYDSGGHLIKVTRPDLSYDEPINEIYTNNAWSNDGNIRSVIETESSEVGALFEEYEIKYSSIENNIPLFFTYYNKDNIYLEWQGCFGKRCKNLPQSVIWTDRTMEPSWVVHSITYNYDYRFENGLITKISVVSTTDKGTSSKEVYELEWW